MSLLPSTSVGPNGFVQKQNILDIGQKTRLFSEM